MKKLKFISPGKILLCGGYLILDPNYKGLSISVNSYFVSSSVSFTDTNKEDFCFDYTKYKNSACLPFNIKVNSENLNKSFEIDNCLIIEYDSKKEIYKFKIKDVNLKGSMDNEFIYFTVISNLFYFIIENYALFDYESYKNNQLCYHIQVNLNGDSSFYCGNSLFNNFKSGLGSSSALITSLSSTIYCSLCELFNIYYDFNLLLPKIAVLSLISNRVASKKVGSGFDIMTCLLGSNVFCQFEEYIYSHDLINQVEKSQFDIDFNQIKVSAENLKKTLSIFSDYFLKLDRIFVNKNSNIKVFLLCNNQSGSNSRILSKKVVEYVNSNGGFMKNELISEINQMNLKIISLFKEVLSKENIPNDYFEDLKECCIKLRSYIRQLSVLSEVNIEPVEFKSILDEFITIDNCFYCIIPGAGGYDGFCLIGKSNVNEEEVKRLAFKYSLLIYKLEISQGIRIYNE